MSREIDGHTGSVGEEFPERRNETLDPSDWENFRQVGHRMLDDMLDYIKNIRKRPVWQPLPHHVRERLRGPVPRLPSDLAAVHEEFMRHVLPFAAGNVHPGFMGWVHGGGTPVGMLAEMLAGGLNANLGGRSQAPIEVERQIVEWTREIFGFPQGATGLFVTGTSMANLIAVVIARDAVLGFNIRYTGLNSETKRLTAYASTEVHSCIGKAMDLCGVGSDALRLIPTDTRHRIELAALAKAIERDRDAGFTPFIVVGSAGTVNTGAIDDLAGLADLCQREKVWFHVDGAFGALAMLSPDLAPRLQGIERADSLAFDFHKWGQVPYDAGYVLVRDGDLHKGAFASSAAYLRRVERGLAAGSPWPCDFGPDLSRGFRALKTWFTLKTYGTEALGAVISRTCKLARYLESRIAETPEFELMAPVELNIVCFRYRAKDADRVNAKIVIDLQESGVAAPSTTLIDGHMTIRAAIVNHRTGRADIDASLDKTLSLGRACAGIIAPGKEVPQIYCPNSARPSVPPKEKKNDESPQAEIARQIEPGSVQFLFEQGNALQKMGRNREARDAYIKLLQIEPSHVGALNNLGNLLVATGKNVAARAVYSEAVARHPNDLTSRVNFAALLFQSGEADKAREHLEHALTIDPNCRQAHAGLSFALADLGNTERAAWHRRTAFQDQFIVPIAYRGEQPPIRVLELIPTNRGAVKIDWFLLDRVFQKYLVATEFYDSRTSLPPHDLVVNAIGDADLAAEALAGAESLLAHTTAPVINPPAAVLATGRCNIAQRLARVPGVVTPKTITLSRELLATPDAQAVLTLHGLEFPLLLRTPGCHGGEHFLRVESPEELPAALAKLPGRNLTAIEFLDARAPDGKTRKYRVMMIDGKLFPLHAAISSHWKIHYFSAEMADNPEHRAEDAAFLENMAGVLGPRAVAALGEIQKTLGLDYGGIDFGLNAQGEVLLFEANATMAIVPPGPDKRWDYRRPAVEQVCKAVGKMLMERAGSAG